MKNIDDIKKDILIELTSVMEKYSNVLFDINFNIGEKSKELVFLEKEYNNYLELNKEIKEKIEKGEDKLLIERKSLDEDIEKFKLVCKKFDEEKHFIKKQISNEVENREIVKKEISILKKERDSLSIYHKQKIILEKEIKYLEDIVINNKNNIKELKKEKIETKGNIKKEKDIAFKELKEVKEDIKKQIKEASPRINNLDKREKEVARKEEDIKIIISRYNRLYKDKGVNFKV